MNNQLGNLDLIFKKIEEIEKERIISKIEDFCTRLKDAVVDFNLKLPPLVSFERYLHRITDIEDVFYAMEQIHECWLHLHPSLLFDRPLKANMSADEFLDQVLSHPDPKYDVMKKEVDRNNISELTISAVKAYEQMDYRYKNAYRRYMDGLFSICKSVCDKFDIKIAENFTTTYALTSSLTKSQIDNVFKAVANDGKMNDDEDTAAAFRSLFSKTISAVEKKILWLDVAKSKTPTYASLYLMFKTMGVEMNEFHKNIICKVFTTPQGSIKPDQLKSRDSNNSEKLKAFEKLVKDAIGRP